MRLAARLLVVLVALAPAARGDDGWSELLPGDLDAWKDPHGAWRYVEAVRPKADNERLLEADAGNGGVLYNGPTGRTGNLVTKASYRDCEVHVEFLVPKGSNSGVKLQGQYEIQINDCHGKEKADARDCGGIYPRAELLPRYRYVDDGFPPRVNACLAPGEWQSLDITFRAPRFDADGEKTADARFVKVVLNGEVIHEDQAVPYPTGHAWHDRERPEGPLLLQGDHGPVAFRNLRVRPLAEGAGGEPTPQG
jgi:hypothetical protein